jgi:hypothetical protein
VAIAQRALKQHGNVTTQQLRGIGLPGSSIQHRVKAGRLYRQYRGVYSVGRPATTPYERATAAVLACGRGAALGHGSAMVLWGYWRRWEEPLEVVIAGDRRVPGITIHRCSTLHWRDVTTQAGIRVTSPARTIFDVSPRLTEKALKRKVSEALHSLWMNESELIELVIRLAHLPPASRIAPLLDLPGTPTRAGWEDGLPGFCKEHGLPIPVMGAVVGGYIVDALFEDEKVIVELDSWEYHKGRIAFETDRERDAQLLALGYRTIRITWERLHARPRQEAERLRTILQNAQAPRAA